MRPSWDEYFLTIAFVVSSRSKDEETNHGTVIVSKDNVILGTGYNSPIKKVNDDLIPKKRPEKYPFMVHSEVNSILNCRVMPKDIGGATAYITGQVCNNCFQYLLQAGVDKFVMAKRHGTYLFNIDTKKIFDFLVEQSKVEIKYMDIDFKWLTEFLPKIKI